MRSWISGLIALALGAFFVLAATRNLERVEKVDWLFGSASNVPLWWALALSALIGGVVAAVVLSVPALRLRLRLHRAERRIAQLEREVHGLRTLPLEAEVRDIGPEA